MKEKHDLKFEVLNDRGNLVAKSYGLVFTLPDDLKEVYLQLGIDLSKYNGDNSWTLPMPASYVIDQSGTIRSAEIEPDYTIRPEPEETIKFLEKLKNG